MPDFTGKSVLVTGAAGAIGQAIARRFVEAGASCLMTDIDIDRVGAAARDIDPSGDRVLVLRQDMADKGDAIRSAEAAAKQFGGLDHLVACAGLYEEAGIDEMTDEAWDRSLAVNLTGVFHTVRAALPHIRAGGSVVTIASMAGHKGSFRHAQYAAAKGGVLAFTRSLAAEAGPSIRANAVSPGLIETPMTAALMKKTGDAWIRSMPLARAGRPDDVAGVVLFLCSDDAAYITGETIHVNGGLYVAS